MFDRGMHPHPRAVRAPSRQGSSAILNHRAPVPGEVRSDYTRSIPISRALGRARSAARPRRAAAGKPTAAASTAARQAQTDTAVFFAADGLRQDIVARYAAHGLLPTMSSFLKKGAVGDGQRAPDPGAAEHGAGWYSLATGAWPGVHGSTNNTFHINGQPFANRTGRSTRTCCRRSRSPRRRSAGGLKVAQVEWAGGRNASIQGPTIDFRSFLSGRGVATNFIGKSGDVLFDDVALHHCVRAPVRPSGWVRRAGAVPGRCSDRRRRAGPAHCRRPSAPPGRCACVCSTSASTSTG